jgi:glycosyltransferase involved in cell wall biosynthesis
VVTVSPGCASDLEKKNNRRVEVIYNGFDPDDYTFNKPELDTSFSVTHFGALNQDRNPVSLWKAMAELSEEAANFKKSLVIQLIGQTDKTIIDEIKNNGLYENLIRIKHLPHKEGLKKLSTSQLLLLPINDAPNAKGILPGKMYEYMAIKRPILAIGPAEADFSRIIQETKSGCVHTFDDVSGIKKTLSAYFDLFLENKLEVRSNSYEKFSRKSLAKKFIELASQSTQ